MTADNLEISTRSVRGGVTGFPVGTLSEWLCGVITDTDMASVNSRRRRVRPGAPARAAELIYTAPPDAHGSRGRASLSR